MSQSRRPRQRHSRARSHGRRGRCGHRKARRLRFGHGAHAAAAKSETSRVTSAIASRTASSCTIATMAVPSRLRSRTMSITAARFSASSEAVGSSSSKIGCAGKRPRARLMRCCSPPENVAGGRLHSRVGHVELPQQSAGPRSGVLATHRFRRQSLSDDVQARQRAAPHAGIA